MYPFFELIGWYQIYTFWLSITISFFVFIWMLKKLSFRFWYDYLIFKKNILWLFLWTFFFSRLFYVISKWNDFKYIKNPFEFFIMNDYNFSLAWAIFWFAVVFWILLKLRKEKLNNFVDWLALSFFLVLIIWFVWALLGGQVYWRDTTYWIEIIYNHSTANIPYLVPVFPLPIIYTILFFILFSTSYIWTMYVNTKALIWYTWMIIFSSLILIFDFFSWKYDIFKESIWINLMQIFSVLIIGFCIYRLSLIFKEK